METLTLFLSNNMQVPLLGLVENMSTYVCPACGHVDNIFGRDGGRRTAEDLGIELLAQVCGMTLTLTVTLTALMSLTQQ